MRSSRPTRKANPDANHAIPKEFLRDRCGGFERAPKEVISNAQAYTANFRGHRLLLIDTSHFGGIFTDYMLECDNGRVVRIEIKTQEAYRKADHNFTDGEKWIQENGFIELVPVCTDDDFYNLLCDLVEDE